MSQRPAQLVGLRKKGRIAPGYDADFCIFVPDDSLRVDPAMIRHKQPLTPYDGRTLTGSVSGSILRGELIDLERPRGELLRRDPQ
jgi:allantoinase